VRCTERNSACVMSKRTFALSGKSANDERESRFSMLRNNVAPSRRVGTPTRGSGPPGGLLRVVRVLVVFVALTL